MSFFSRCSLEELAPSRKHGIDSRTEASYRWSYCEFLKEAGVELKMPQLTIATAVVFCHRFYAQQSHGDSHNNRFIIAAACLFLAGKVEETPKPLKEIARISFLIQYKNELEIALQQIQQKDFLDEQKEIILMAERNLLHSIAFDFNVDHPYKHLLNVVKQVTRIKEIGDKHSRGLAQVAWNFTNDSLRTTLCLQFTAQDIAKATIFLASKLLLEHLRLPDTWWVTCELNKSVCEEICNQIMDLYDGSELTSVSARC